MSFRLTPAPHIQTLVFFVVPWMAALGTSLLSAYSAEPTRVRPDRSLIAAAAILCVLGLRWFSISTPLTLTGALAYFWMRSRAGLRMRNGFVLMSFVPFVLYVSRFANSMRKQEVIGQIRFIEAVERLVPAGKPVFSPWPVVAPFRPAAAYHWFSAQGLAHALPAGTLDNEWMTMLDGRTRIIVINRERIAKTAPRFARQLETNCRKSATGPRILDSVQIFDCRPR